MDIQLDNEGEDGVHLKFRILSSHGILKAVVEVFEDHSGEVHYNLFFHEQGKGLPSCNVYIEKDFYGKLEKLPAHVS